MNTANIFLCLGLLGEMECRVSWDFSPERPATFDGPAEQESYEVTDLVALVPNLSGVKTPIDITDLMTDKTHDNIVDAIKEWELEE